MAGMMVVIGIKDAAKILRESGFQVSEADLRAGLDQKVYPFGDSVIVTSRSSAAGSTREAPSAVDCTERRKL